jgi:guanylate kinase
VKRGRLYVVSGPSGAGKSSVVDVLPNRRPFHFSVSATTRAKRPHEEEGIDYFFVDRANFEGMIAAKGLLEWAEYNGNLYGTPAAAVEEHLSAGEDVVLEIEVQGAAQVKGQRPDAVMIFIAPPSIDVLEARLTSRGDTALADIERRLQIAKSELASAPDLFDHFVVNENLEDAVAAVADIMED